MSMNNKRVKVVGDHLEGWLLATVRVQEDTYSKVELLDLDTFAILGQKILCCGGTIVSTVECLTAHPVSTRQMAVVLPTMTVKRSPDFGKVL